MGTCFFGEIAGDHLSGVGKAKPAHRAQISGSTRRGSRALATIDMGNAAMAQLVEVFDGESRAMGIVGGDRSKTDLGEWPPNRHECDLGCNRFMTGRR